MKELIIEILLKIIPEIKEFNLENSLTVPPNQEMGDISFPCFPLAKEFKVSPAQVAENFKNRFDSVEDIEAKVVGPYLNMTFSDKFLWDKFITQEIKYSGGKKSEKIMIEYSSPNTNKPQHLGHVRTNLIGMALSNILKRDGYDVVRCNLCNDRGIAICKSMIAYKYLGNGVTPESLGVKGDHLVGDYYVKYNELCEICGKERIEKETSEMLLAWEAGDNEVIELWKKMNDWTLKGWEETYTRMGCEFDAIYFESDTYMDGKDIVSEGLKKGVFQSKENGAIFADLNKYGLGEKILQRGDGTSIYITQDIGTTLRKFREYSLNKSVWVVANEQDHHFKCLFAILDMLGYHEMANNCYHLSYGYISLPSGRMKSREGTVVDADRLMDELEEISYDLMKSHDMELPEEELKNKAKIISQAAMKFYFLQFSASKDFVFDPKASISFEGKTGPYILYSYARIKSILRKAGIQDEPQFSKDFGMLGGQEKSLLKFLFNYQEAIKSASKDYEVSNLVKYLYELAQELNTYYHHTPILIENQTVKSNRLYLIYQVAEVLKDGLSLLGIDTLEKM